MMIDIVFEGGKKINAVVKGFTIKTDQDINSGGEGTAPDPFTVFLSSIAACAGFYTKTFCDQRRIPVDDINLRMETKYNPEMKMITGIQIGIHVPPDFPEKYDNALVNSVNLCTVRRHLSDKIQVDILVTR
jgi:putative redox protein